MNEDVSLANSEYWNELCGSRAARKLGITAGDPQGVQTFDAWFFDFYPYIKGERFIPWGLLEGSRVLEIGLGYGTVSRRLGDASKHVVSLDIATNAVKFVRDTAPKVSPVTSSALQLPFADGVFDYVITLGCLHHTGDMEAAIRECLRVLRPGGRMVLMVYNRYSYKRWIVSPLDTWKWWRSERSGAPANGKTSATRRVSWFWDRSPSGSAPPHTEFATHTQLLRVFGEVHEIEISTTNVDNLTDLLPQHLQSVRLDQLRLRLLNSWLSRRLGLDLYVTVVK